MTRLIDADELKKAIEPLANKYSVVTCAYRYMLDLIDNAPTVELTANDCDLIQFGECSYAETGCSDCKIKQKIRKALKRPQGEWIPIKMRPGTDEEYEEFCKYGDCPREDFRVFECPLPDDDQEVLVTTRWGDICVDIWHRDVDCCYFENNCDDDDVIAWMPLPEAYTEKDNEQK